MRTIAIAALLFAATAAPALAQDATESQTAALDQSMADPANHEATYTYVRACVAARDYEAAIAALERLLAFNPDLTRVRYELGTLYARLGSFAMAVKYFEEVLADPNIDTPLRNRVEAYLPEARKQLQVSRLTGSVFAGIRYNSNVSGATTAPRISTGSLFSAEERAIRARTPAVYAKESGSSAVAMGELSHVFDFRTERALQWETDIAAYGARQFDDADPFLFRGQQLLPTPDLDVAVYQLRSGPRIAVNDGPVTPITFKPYVITTGSYAAESDFIWTAGGGAEIVIPIGFFYVISPSIEAVRVEQGDLDGLTLFPLSTGSLVTGSLSTRWNIAEGITLDTRSFYAVNDADVFRDDDGAVVLDPSSTHQGFEAAVKFDFAPPIEQLGVDWSLTAFLRYTEIRFDAPNLIVDRAVKRRDEITRVGLLLDMPIVANFGLSVLGEYMDYESNQVNFEADAWSVMAGPSVRF